MTVREHRFPEDGAATADEADAPAGLRNLGIEGYAVKANLSNDQLDQLVDSILKPSDQVEDTSLEEADTEVV